MNLDGMYYKLSKEYYHLDGMKRKLMRERDKISARLEEVEGVLIDLNDILCKHGKHVYEHFEEDREAKEKVIEVLKQPEQRWIPVTERLPENNYACLVTVLALPNLKSEEDQGIVYPDYVGWDGEAWVNSDGCVIPFEVVAWMPLPEPFKEV